LVVARNRLPPLCSRSTPAVSPLWPPTHALDWHHRLIAGKTASWSVGSIPARSQNLNASPPHENGPCGSPVHLAVVARSLKDGSA
jgi:hypothetical protein